MVDYEIEYKEACLVIRDLQEREKELLSIIRDLERELNGISYYL